MLKTSNRKKLTYAKNKIGAPNIDVLCLLFGSLLGDCHGQQRSSSSVRFTMNQSNKNVEYLM